MGERRGTKALEMWCRRLTEGYPGVKIDNMTTSWRDGLAFCAIIHHFRPDLIDFTKLNKDDVYYNNSLAFRVAERHLGIPALLDAEDMVEFPVPDRLSILTYLSQFYQVFVGTSGSPTRIVAKRPAVPTDGCLSPPSSSPPAKMAARSGASSGPLGRREPCLRCQMPVFLAERLHVGSKLYHRTCFRCARCNNQLSLANCYETETDGVYCCETCPDEEVKKIEVQNTVDGDPKLLRPLSDEEKSKGMLEFDDYEQSFENALETESPIAIARKKWSSQILFDEITENSPPITENSPPITPQKDLISPKTPSESERSPPKSVSPQIQTPLKQQSPPKEISKFDTPPKSPEKGSDTDLTPQKLSSKQSPLKETLSKFDMGSSQDPQKDLSLNRSSLKDKLSKFETGPPKNPQKISPPKFDMGLPQNIGKNSQTDQIGTQKRQSTSTLEDLLKKARHNAEKTPLISPELKQNFEKTEVPPLPKTKPPDLNKSNENLSDIRISFVTNSENKTENNDIVTKENIVKNRLKMFEVPQENVPTKTIDVSKYFPNRASNSQKTSSENILVDSDILKNNKGEQTNENKNLKSDYIQNKSTTKNIPESLEPKLNSPAQSIDPKHIKDPQDEVETELDQKGSRNLKIDTIQISDESVELGTVQLDKDEGLNNLEPHLNTSKTLNSNTISTTESIELKAIDLNPEKNSGSLNFDKKTDDSVDLWSGKLSGQDSLKSFELKENKVISGKEKNVSTGDQKEKIATDKDTGIVTTGDQNKQKVATKYQITTNSDDEDVITSCPKVVAQQIGQKNDCNKIVTAENCILGTENQSVSGGQATEDHLKVLGVSTDNQSQQKFTSDDQKVATSDQNNYKIAPDGQFLNLSSVQSNEGNQSDKGLITDNFSGKKIARGDQKVSSDNKISNNDGEISCPEVSTDIHSVEEITGEQTGQNVSPGDQNSIKVVTDLPILTKSVEQADNELASCSDVLDVSTVDQGVKKLTTDDQNGQKVSTSNQISHEVGSDVQISTKSVGEDGVIISPEVLDVSIIHESGEKRAVDDQNGQIVTGDHKAALDDRKSALDDQKAALDEQKAALDDQKASLDNQKVALDEQKAALDDQKAALDDQISTKSAGKVNVDGLVIDPNLVNASLVDQSGKVSGLLSTNKNSIIPLPDSDYPEDLNPFSDSEEEPKKVIRPTDLYPLDLKEYNPFDEDVHEKPPRPPQPKERKLLEAPKINLNPFWSDDNEPSEEEVEKPVPAPRRTLGTPEPKPRSRGEQYDSNSSLSSYSSSLNSSISKTPRKKKRAPLPPGQLQSPKDVNSTSKPSSPRLTPRVHRKTRKAPPPPSSTPQSINLLELTLSSVEGHPSGQNLDISIGETPFSTIDSSTLSTDVEKEKIDKDETNRNRQSQSIASSISESEGFSPTVPDKSTFGKWKRRKGPAPSRPVPQRRQIKPLPLQELRRELDIIELQQQGLEKQGVKLEQLIREKCEAPGVADDAALSPEVEELVLELFELVNEKNELFRRQAELMYLRRQQRLEEEYADLEYQIRCLMDQPERNKTDSDKAREEELINRLVEVVERRNEIVECLEMDRVREAEEDFSISTRLNLIAAKREEELNETPVKLSKKEKKKIRKEKKLKEKGKNMDIDKDINETEINKTLKEKKKRKWF